MREKYYSNGKCIYKSINEKPKRLGCLDHAHHARKITEELNHLQAWGESNIFIAGSLAEYIKAYDEILDAFINGIESEKRIDPNNQEFQEKMDFTLKYLKRLKEEFTNVDEYLAKKKEMEKHYFSEVEENE